ncbi:YeeE/YedE family protein [bacterium]|nr:YeeE/YedE family protein [candidate division CSSED10-310 bacterium]
MDWLAEPRWSPYIVGIGIGLLSCIAFLLSNRPIGCSSAFSRSIGMIESLIRGKKIRKKPYYQKFPPVIDWEWMLVIGIVIGAFISAKLSGTFAFQMIPEALNRQSDSVSIWREHFGNTPFLRWITAFTGGILMGIGSRWAGGCTSGHGISGTLQLSVSSWLAVICFFTGGAITAYLIFLG